MPLDNRQHDLPLGLNPQACFEDIAARSFPLPELGKLFQARFLQPPPFQSLLCSHDKEKRFSRSDMRSWCAAATPHGALESSQKRLLIFDQSGDQTRLLRSPFPQAAEPAKLSGLEKAFVEDRETFNENRSNEKESEMHEDTEEINALLYSDDDYESDEEVMSTGHSPYDPIELEEIDDPPRKKQKLLDKLSDSCTKIPESNISTKEDWFSDLTNEQSRKDKIRTALKILESVVPGAKGNEALLLLDEAIDYLKLLKRDLNRNLHQSLKTDKA